MFLFLFYYSFAFIELLLEVNLHDRLTNIILNILTISKHASLKATFLVCKQCL